ncbi:MAG: PAS domain-containing protein [Janthinobacterium lividum]
MPLLVASPSVAYAVPADLLDDAELGIVHFRPVYAVSDPATIVDLAYLRLNPAAQRLLRLPEVPTATFRTLHPQAEAEFRFYRDAFLAGTLCATDLGYPSGWRARAQRYGTGLAVSLTAALPLLSELPARTAATRLAASYSALARTQHMAQQLTQERDVLHRVLAQTPTPICLLHGPEYQFEYVNSAFAELFAHRKLEGLPAAEVLPAALNQGFITLLDRVYETGETVLEVELPLASPLLASPRYFNFLYQAHLENGHAERLSLFAYEVTEQVLARQQVQQLNEQLEARVAERTQQVEAALREAEQQRAQLGEQQGLLRQILGQLPAAVATLAGPEHRFVFFNESYQAIANNRAQLGRPVAEALPELVEQGFVGILDKVYASSQPYRGQRKPAWLQQAGTSKPALVYVDFLYQPLKDAQGQTQGILAFIWK